MVIERTSAARPRSGKIRRGHSGCKACRRRGKLCDEGKPACLACYRLSLHCEYGRDISFHHYNGAKAHAASFRDSLVYQVAECHGTASLIKWQDPSYELKFTGTRSNAIPPVAPFGEDDILGVYFKHFESHVSKVLPGVPAGFSKTIRSSAALCYAVLCLSASNLAMLDARVDHRQISQDQRSSVFSPIANRAHYNRAREYHDRAVLSLESEEISKEPSSCASALAAKVLLAIYHHASTDHLRFQMAVEDSNHFVNKHVATIMQSADARESLQMWHRLSVSSRTSRRPTLLIEDEANVCSRPNPALPNTVEQLHLTCILGMSSDDLIYDILIKTVELRRRAVVFRAVSGVANVSDQSQGLGRLAHQHLDRLLGRWSSKEEYEEAESTFIQGPHLISLLKTQQDRLSVWRSRLDVAQLPPEIWSDPDSSRCSKDSKNESRTLPSHRDAMNGLYYFLCQIMIATLRGNDSLQDSPTESGQSYLPWVETMVQMMVCIIDTLEFSTSSTSDVYTFSLTEVLVQLSLTWHSTSTFRHILDTTWPRLEAGGRGFEHSHCPTHLAKRIITLLADLWSQGQAVTYASLAVEESVPKLQLLAIGQPVDLVLCGHGADGTSFITRTQLP
ncbi:hypothetical protein PV08_05097 [Exophiala spinifera]|uniref:Zn(2)-C6 fungal-type domain-containing protein n=1 Tax=Exophiala spinifera TaxID=91928 RepID=A0A0D1ZZ15_9EURO|nr:uncharacterized protein PV08_05097 [Exophiala spinifera]KIW17902.1 hypothetical protein PV08_05097 [Exophiala spinifera]